MRTRIAVDVGGTFTDLVMSDDETGRIVIGKVPTVPDAPDKGVLGVLSSVLAAADVECSEYFLHGTTVGLNALLESRQRFSHVFLLADRFHQGSAGLRHVPVCGHLLVDSLFDLFGILLV